VGSATSKSDSETNSKTSNSADVKLTTRVNKIYMKNDVVLTNPELNFDFIGGKLQKATLRGNYPNGSYLNFTKNEDAFTIQSNNAGLTTKALGLTNKIDGGTLYTTGKMANKNDFDGQITMEAFQVVKAPALAKLLSVASITVTSLDSLATLTGASGVKFTKMICSIKFENGVLQLSECSAKGSTMAITGSGTIDTNKDDIDIKGVIIPENIVNQVLKNVPILKDVFGGKKENEALGINYSVKGTIDDPQVDANPLSLLTPGFLRNIFNKF
jgi:hypothetical protein